MTFSSLNDFAVHVVGQLRAEGFVAYFAGGCVRDQLLSLAPKDYDVATDARPADVRRIFGKRRTLAIGESFGVIAVLGPKPCGSVEVATFRSDGVYSDGRRPDSIEYATAEEDARRRDFTINGMFYDPLADEVIDFVQGQKDLASRKVRAIGDPLARISEDRLRMLRAVRFASTYAFTIDRATLAAIQQQASEIACVSQERITAELERMLCHPSRRTALELLYVSGLLVHVLPPLGTDVVRDAARWRRLLDILGRLEATSLGLVLATLFGISGAKLSDKALQAECRRLKVSNQVRLGAGWIAAHLHALAQAAVLPFSQLQPLLISDHIEAALTLLESIAAVDGSAVHTEGSQRCRELLALPASQLNPPPLIRGDELRALGITPGPAFKRILQTIRNAQLDQTIATKQQALELARGLAVET